MNTGWGGAITPSPPWICDCSKLQTSDVFFEAEYAPKLFSAGTQSASTALGELKAIPRIP